MGALHISDRVHVLALSSLRSRGLVSVNPTRARNYGSSTDALPRVAQPSIWHSMVPKFLRERRVSPNIARAQRPKDWNPATFYIVIFLLIGSNAIQMIALRNDFLTFSRRADAKISLLKEVLERVQAGEAVDVEGLLGTGNEEKEKEWEEALKEIEEDELLWETKASKMAKKARQAFHESTAAAGSGKEDGCTLASTSLFNEEAKSENNPGTGDSRANSMKSSRQPLSFY